MFGGDDSFTGIEDLFNQLAGGRRYSSGATRAQAQSLLNTIESKKETILIFDLSGKKMTSVDIKDDLETNEYGERVHNGQKVLAIKLENGETLKFGLPKPLAKRKLNHTFTHGILEVSLKK
ncbi:hypothetical protein HNV12_02760 [Methanococcoides sp. SA1]|nr:hypothetical protein [Methanococcoides sp. SA1]